MKRKNTMIIVEDEKELTTEEFETVELIIQADFENETAIPLKDRYRILYMLEQQKRKVIK